jgi:nitrogen fixation NifU-like protein
MVSEMAMGKTLEEAALITNEKVAEELGGLPKNKMHCSNLGADALHLAIANYKARQSGAAAGPAVDSSDHDHEGEKDECACPYCDGPLEGMENLCSCRHCDIELVECGHCGKYTNKAEADCTHCGAALA